MESAKNTNRNAILFIVLITLLLLLGLSFIIQNGKEKTKTDELTVLKKKNDSLQKTLEISEKEKRQRQDDDNRIKEEQRKREEAKFEFDNIVTYIKDRCNSGASQNVALGQYQDLEVEWKVKIDYVCYGISGNPVQFTKKNTNILGFPSYGLDEFKFIYLCEGNQNKMCTLKGKLRKATDNPLLTSEGKILTFTMEVTSIMLN